MTKLAENLLDKMIATDTSEGVGCDNMSVTIIQIKKQNQDLSSDK